MPQFARRSWPATSGNGPRGRVEVDADRIRKTTRKRIQQRLVSKEDERCRFRGVRGRLLRPNSNAIHAVVDPDP